MDLTKFTLLLLLLLGLVSTSISDSLSNGDHKQCERIVRKWKALTSAIDEDIKGDKHTLRDLLFFLHVPRTGGRTYFHCFLKKLYSTALECPRSYDKLRFDPSKSDCRLLATHDDYSMISKLPKEKTSVVTILRNPIDRVFSTYEFSLEVAARFLVHQNLTFAKRIAAKIRSKTKGVSTLDIWPWKYLVPWMRKDLFARREARGQHVFKSDDSYNMEEISMPLHVYINDPVALEIIHNGATFQVAGLTNNSQSLEAHDVRHCVKKYQDLGSHVLEVAKKRLEGMLYVGITDEHRESASLFANVVGSQIISQLISSSSRTEIEPNKISETDSPDVRPDETDNQHPANSADEKVHDSLTSDKFGTTNKTMTVAKLMEAYEICISNLRKTQGQRRVASLKNISPANFSKKARREVPDVVLQQIESLNRLDVELYKHAQDIFAKQHRHSIQKVGGVVKQESIFDNFYDASLLKFPLVAISIILVSLILFLFVNARRRVLKSKIKK